MDFFSPCVLLLGALPIIAFFLYLRCFHPPSFQVLKRNGIPGPAPSFFFGNYKEKLRLGTLQFLRELHGKFGHIAGYYIGHEAQVSVIDPKLMKSILVEDFDSFSDRTPIPEIMTSTIGESLLCSRGAAWKLHRNTLSSIFSAFKMEAMTPIIQKSVKSLANVFREHADKNKSFEVSSVYISFTMETIFSTAFGQVIEIQNGQSNHLAEAAGKVFGRNQDSKWVSPLFWMILLTNFPWLEPVLAFMYKGSEREKCFAVLYDAAKEKIRERRMEKDAVKHMDLLQFMIDATAEGEEGEGMKNKLTDSQIIGNAITFMLAGYETTANALSYTSYLLAINPHVQEKLQEEIDTYLEENPEASPYQTTQDLDYLDMVLQETLRLYPPSPKFSRHCIEDYGYGGITIPKGAIVGFPCAMLQMDPQFWTNPDTFNPLRFTAEEKAKRPQLCYMPFGYGPRNCIGMRFAMLEAKLALMELLRRVSFVRAPDTQVPLKTVDGISTAPKDGVYLKVVTRNSCHSSQ